MAWLKRYDHLPYVGFVEAIPKEEIKIFTQRVEEAVVGHEVAVYMESLPSVCIAVLGCNKSVRVNISEKRRCTVNEQGDVLTAEGDTFVEGKIEVLNWARNNDKKVHRSLVRKHFKTYLEIAEKSELTRALEIYRDMRAVDGISNRLGKLESVYYKGGGTLGKIRRLRERCTEKNCLVFGVAGEHHMMSAVRGGRLFVDTNSDNEGPFILGSIKDWREYVQKGDLIISDVSLGDGYEGGMDIPGWVKDVYKDMTREGYRVICKMDKRWAFDCVDYEVYRPHNFEVFVLLSPVKEENTIELNLDYFEEDMRAWNVRRMWAYLSRKYESGDRHLRVTEGEILAVSAQARYRVGGKKADSVVCDHLGGVKRAKHWEHLCMEESEEAGFFEEYLETQIELPAIFLDLGYLSKDADRLYSSLRKNYVCEYDDIVGWVAVEEKGQSVMERVKV